MKTVTDRKLLKTIYDLYEKDYLNFEKDNPNRSAKIYVPIDCDLVAEKLSTEPGLVFGRLYYHLDKKHRYKQENGSSVHLFALRVGSDINSIHFPLLASVIAELDDSFRRFTIPLVISSLAFLVSLGSLVSNVI
ncbi:hypothetical protein Glaag_3009 [Glaciecola sp. 4H-3-7+YE-5]|nr:hypothetical protein Glaag_3009 [Glaciecola sp. 4H-3-7+YE-5]